MTQPSEIRLLIADDQEIIRGGVKSMLRGTQIKVVAEAATGQQAAKYVLENDVDVLLMDIRMPDGDGLNALSRIKLDKPKLPILLFSAFNNPTYVARAVALGVSGFLLKDCTYDELLSAIRIAATGVSLWTRDELRHVSGALATPQPGDDIEARLTEREKQVLQHLAGGLTNKQIAAAMHLSYETIKEHVQHVMRKIGVSDRTQAAVWAVRKGLA
jgi:DNA-binding NarL/FixJ family response regulator